MSKKKKDKGGMGVVPGSPGTDSLAKLGRDSSLLAALDGKGDASGVASLVKGDVTLVRQTDQFIPARAESIVTAGSRDHALAVRERAAETRKAITLEDQIKRDYEGQFAQLNAQLHAKDAEIERITLEYNRLKAENTKLRHEREQVEGIGEASGEGMKAKKKKKVNVWA